MSRRTKAETEELNDLRQENADLKRKLARLRKELLKFRGTEEDSADDEEPVLTSAPTNGPKCQKCGNAEFKVFNTPQSTVRICTYCKTRTKI